ncbi:MAG: AMP-binding protein [Candidatus Protistobacter heckmanni]|nr:AMP-binding protein [Candidatus Protistobacter heckmanni]
MNDFYDALDAHSPAQRDRDLMAALPGHVAHAKARSPFYAGLLAEVDAAAVSSREALGALPVTRKSALAERHKAEPPFGGVNVMPPGRYRRVFQSPGNLHEPQTEGPAPFRMARALHAVGFRPVDLAHNGFSYHFTPGAWIMETGLHKLGCGMFPGGTWQTELQAQAHLRPDGYVGTPSWLKIILEKADELGLDSGSMRRALVSGEALPPLLRAWFTQRGVAMMQAYATADLSLIAYETQAEGAPLPGLLVDEGVLVEIIEPNGGKPMLDGEVGAVVVTTFAPDYPVIRFATGDISAFLPEAPSACGRTGRRLNGWLGRADQTTKILGMFVHPGQVGEVLRWHPQVKKARLVVSGTIGAEVMRLHAELGGAEGSADLETQIAGSLREVTKLRSEVVFAAPGSLPEDGKLIEDQRSYD